MSTDLDYEETTLILRRHLQRKLASRDLEVISFDVAVDEVTAAQDHHGVAMAALILPNLHWVQELAQVLRGSLTRKATEPPQKEWM